MCKLIGFCFRRAVDKLSSDADRNKKEIDDLQKKLERELEDKKLEMLEVCNYH